MIAAKIATSAGADMVIANSEDIHIIHRIMDGRNLGTIFCANKEVFGCQFTYTLIMKLLRQQ